MLSQSAHGFCWNSAGPIVAGLAMVPGPTTGVSNGLNQLADQLEIFPAISSALPWAYSRQVERLMLPGVLWAGPTSLSQALQKLAVPGRSTVAYQLLRPTQGNAGRDLWIEVEPSAGVLSGWSAITTMPWVAPAAELSFWPQPTPLPMLTGPNGAADFVTEWPNQVGGLPGVQQHPVYGQSLDAGGGDGCGNDRPGSGVLWPRGSS